MDNSVSKKLYVFIKSIFIISSHKKYFFFTFSNNELHFHILSYVFRLSVKMWI